MSERTPQEEQLTEAERENIVLMSGISHPQLAEEVADELGMPLYPLNTAIHPNGDLYNQIDDNVRGHNVYIIQSHVAIPGFSISQSNRQHLEFISGAKKAGAARIFAIAPTYEGARQDRRAEAREAVGSAITLRGFATEGADELILVDPHSQQALEVFTGVTTPITARYELQKPVLDRLDHHLENCIVVGGDEGSAKLVRDWGNDLGIKFKVYPKVKNGKRIIHPDVSSKDVRGKTVIYADDMIDTAATLASLSRRVTQAGAKRQIAAATHLWLSGRAVSRLERSDIEAFVGTNTIPIKPAAEERLEGRLEVPSVAWILADTIRRIIRNESVSQQPYGKVYS